MNHHNHGAGWGIAASATLHCLTGCAIGEVLGLVIGTVAGLHNATTVVLAVALAFAFGYSLTVLGTVRAGLSMPRAVRVALAADTISITVMEIVDNTVMVAVPGAMDAGLTSMLFWGALAFSLVVAFVVTLPVNRWLIGRGKGHAVVHELHGSGRAHPRTVVAVPANAPDHAAKGAGLRQIRSLDPPMVPLAAGGLAVWAVVGLVLLALRSTLVEQGREVWLTICLAGFLVGLPGLATMIVHDANRRRRRAVSQQAVSPQAVSQQDD